MVSHLEEMEHQLAINAELEEDIVELEERIKELEGINEELKDKIKKMYKEIVNSINKDEINKCNNCSYYRNTIK